MTRAARAPAGSMALTAAAVVLVATLVLGWSAGASATTMAAAPRASSGNGTAATNDRGVVHEIFKNLGASSETAHTAQIYLDGPIKVAAILLVAFILVRLVGP